MSSKIFPLLISFFGIFSTFLPWVIYPKSDMKLYGYMGDGVITGFLFSILFLFGIISFWIKQDKSFNISLLVIGFINFIFGISKLYSLRLEQQNFTSDNFAIVSVTSGFHEGSGLYVLMFSGLMCFIFGMFNILSKQSLEPRFKPTFAYSLIPVGLLLFGGISLYFNPSFLYITKNSIPDNIEQIIEKDIKQMVRALETNDYPTYQKFVHQSVRDGLGGDENLKMFFEGIYKTFQADGVKVKNIEVGQILDTQTDDLYVQSLFTQRVTFNQNGKESTQEQKTLGIKERNSTQWKYIIIEENKSTDELKKIFPKINLNLKGIN